MTCPVCGRPTTGIIGTLFHCDPSEPIDDIEDDGDTVVRGDA
jgi:hypothetical protein